MELLFRIDKSMDVVFAYLTDMQKFASVHPVITHIDQTGPDRYLIHETLKLGFIPYSFTYPATIEANPIDHTVNMRAVVFKLVRIEMHFAILAEGDHTQIKETIHFSTKLPVISTMGKIFKEQHTQLFKNIEAASAWE